MFATERGDIINGPITRRIGFHAVETGSGHDERSYRLSETSASAKVAMPV
jgi:hypothetical protein